MKNKTCGECRHLGSAKETGVCEKRKICLYPEELPACSNFAQKVITNGEKLWNSGYDSVITFSKTWMEKFSCWAEAEDWLNAPADEEVKNEC